MILYLKYKALIPRIFQCYELSFQKGPIPICRFGKRYRSSLTYDKGDNPFLNYLPFRENRTIDSYKRILPDFFS